MTQQDITTPAPREDGVSVVLPGDNRQPVADSMTAPYRWVGQLAITWQDGLMGIGTATLIDDTHALTCAHNLFNTTRGWCRRVTLSPACNRNAKGDLFRPWQLEVAGLAVPEDYRTAPVPLPPVDGIPRPEITRYLYDYAVIRLARPVPDPLHRPKFQVESAGPSDGKPGMIIGYSGDRDDTASTQFYRHGTLHLDQTSDLVSYEMSTYNGDSGSAVFWQRPGRHHLSIVGVHVTGVAPTHPGAKDGLNFGPALDPETIHRLIEVSDMDNTLR